MHERILVPLDGSKVGETALPYVKKLLSKLSPEIKVEVTLLQVLSALVQAVVAGEEIAAIPYTEEETKQAKERAMGYLNKSGKVLKGKGVMVKSRVVIGDAAEEIVKVAEEISVDLIAMSTHGRTGLSRLAFGSVADKVLRWGGKIPILMVKAPK